MTWISGELDNEINKLYVDINVNVTSTMTRIYEGSDQFKQPPIPKKMDSFNYICEEIMVWAGKNVGLDYSYSAWFEIFEEVEDGRLFGLYIPWSEEYNIAVFFMIDTLSRFVDLLNIYDRQHGHPENLTIDVIRMYERFEP